MNGSRSFRKSLCITAHPWFVLVLQVSSRKLVDVGPEFQLQQTTQSKQQAEISHKQKRKRKKKKVEEGIETL